MQIGQLHDLIAIEFRGQSFGGNAVFGDGQAQVAVQQQYAYNGKYYDIKFGNKLDCGSHPFGKMN